MKKILRNLYFPSAKLTPQNNKKKPNNTEAYKWNERQNENRDIHTVVFFRKKNNRMKYANHSIDVVHTPM